MTKSVPSKKYRIVPRAPGDAAPLDPKIAEAIRNAGMDPALFTLAPFEAGESDASVAALFTAGTRLKHTFAFGTLNGALRAIERIVDDDLAARITKQDANGSSSSTAAPTPMSRRPTFTDRSRPASQSSLRKTAGSATSR